MLLKGADQDTSTFLHISTLEMHTTFTHEHISDQNVWACFVVMVVTPKCSPSTMKLNKWSMPFSEHLCHS